MLIQHLYQANDSAASERGIHLVSRENEKVDVLFFRLPLHGELPVRHNLRAVHNDLRSVLMRQLRNTVDIRYITGDV